MIIDINQQDVLCKEAEHTISYTARRAIEMYLPVWEKEPAFYLFDKCAEQWNLCRGEIIKCKDLMRKFGHPEDIKD